MEKFLNDAVRKRILVDLICHTDKGIETFSKVKIVEHSAAGIVIQTNRALRSAIPFSAIIRMLGVPNPDFKEPKPPMSWADSPNKPKDRG